MSDEMNNQPVMNHDGYEHEDMGIRGVFYFFAGLLVFTIIIYFIAFGIYNYLNTQTMAGQQAMSPLVTAPADTRAVSDEDTKAFPQPRLEKDEGSDIQQAVEGQDRTLATYDWVDKDKGAVHIPIDRAMDLIVQRGLPVLPAGAAAQTPKPAKKTKRGVEEITPATDGN